MDWFCWLILAVIVTAVAGVTGIQPAKTRPIGHTRLMHVSRFVLAVLVIVLAYAAFRAHAGA
jgi:hypothetical protein